jgi:hypothetical protein
MTCALYWDGFPKDDWPKERPQSSSLLAPTACRLSMFCPALVNCALQDFGLRLVWPTSPSQVCGVSVVCTSSFIHFQHFRLAQGNWKLGCYLKNT